ncbi:dUTP diphosphatase [Halalkalibacter sp. APA_J-10(15)]|uniref:dUTP diphosphatase n=1 Tax=Halalkalibacter sp. APA_J-10(15) TaxID=2933805 RepID=UPI001FF20FC9|nr:dUTP diphosphatase [Halalkalibacter sp. APA_J-10(15)]MCK0471417.1 dUTP diphosphatase [Halalkalibacter sp. APA_J-10(15)]
MNLYKLIAQQRSLDTSIYVEKNLDPSKLLVDKVIGLMTELGEAMNEWRAFKYWSNDPIPREEELLFELVDGIHFTISIGLDCNYALRAAPYISISENDFEVDVKRSVLTLFYLITVFEQKRSFNNYVYMLQALIDLIIELGFDWGEVEAAYEKKNKINQLRQVEGY